MNVKSKIMKNKETLEEAAERISKSHSVHETGQDDVYQGVIQGAKWQQERMYSEEEVKNLLYLFLEYIGKVQNKTILDVVPKDWFEQFKKK